MSKKKILKITIVICAMLVVGLVIVNVIIGVSKHEEYKDDSGSGLVSDDMSDEAKEKILEYQKKIDGAEQGEEKVKIYKERVFYLIECDENDVYKDNILNDFIEIDNIEKSIGSATNVVNYAKYFKADEVWEKYLKILEERKKAEEHNEDFEVVW